jgi:hypothetical protein
MAVIVKVSQGHRKDLVANGGKTRGRERAVSIVGKDRDGIEIAVSDYNIWFAIAIEVANGSRLGVSEALKGEE